MMKSEDTPLFVVDHNPSVMWPVYLRLPADGGSFAVHRFQVRLNVLPEARYAELLDGNSSEAAQRDNDKPTHEVLADNALRFPEFVCGFGDDLRDSQGDPIAFSVEKLQELVVGPYGGPLSVGLWRAITEVRYGARLGNFEPPPAAGAQAGAAAET